MSRPVKSKKSRHGLTIFRTYTLTHLADISSYSRDYVSDIRCGAQPLNSRFMRVMATVLGRPERELFQKNGTNGSRPKAPRRPPTNTTTRKRRGTSGR